MRILNIYLARRQSLRPNEHFSSRLNRSFQICFLPGPPQTKLPWKVGHIYIYTFFLIKKIQSSTRPLYLSHFSVFFSPSTFTMNHHPPSTFPLFNSSLTPLKDSNGNTPPPSPKKTKNKKKQKKKVFKPLRSNAIPP